MSQELDLKPYQLAYIEFIRWKRKTEPQSGGLNEVCYQTRPNIIGQIKNLNERSTFPPEIAQLVKETGEHINTHLKSHFAELVEISYHFLTANKQDLTMEERYAFLAESIVQAWTDLIKQLADTPEGLKIVIGFFFAWAGTGDTGMDVAIDHLNNFFWDHSPLHKGLPAKDFLHVYGKRENNTGKNDSITYCPFHEAANTMFSEINNAMDTIEIPRHHMEITDEEDLENVIPHFHRFFEELSGRIGNTLKETLRAKGFFSKPQR